MQNLAYYLDRVWTLWCLKNSQCAKSYYLVHLFLSVDDLRSLNKEFVHDEDLPLFKSTPKKPALENGFELSCKYCDKKFDTRAKLVLHKEKTHDMCADETIISIDNEGYF